MKKIFSVLVMTATVSGFIACSNSKAPAQEQVEGETVETWQVKSKDRAEKVSKPFRPTLNVYNMGGVPAKDVDELVVALHRVYPNTKYAGALELVDSAYIKNAPKGKNRYWWSKLLSHLKKTTDVRNGITLVIVNAEVCNWTKKR